VAAPVAAGLQAGSSERRAEARRLHL